MLQIAYPTARKGRSSRLDLSHGQQPVSSEQLDGSCLAHARGDHSSALPQDAWQVPW